MSDNIELKPCPFCGGKPDLHSKDTPTGVSYVECVECGVQMGGDSDTEVAEQWNNRQEVRREMSDKTNDARFGIVNMDDASLARLTRLMEAYHLRFYAGSEVYNLLMGISIALQDMHRVRSETVQIIADGVSRRVFGLVASLLGINKKGETK